MFRAPTFEDAVRLFKDWGFQVEPGPRCEEVTLILEGPGFRTVVVHPACLLPELAAVALRVRWKNGAVFNASARQPKRASPAAMPYPARTAPTFVH